MLKKNLIAGLLLIARGLFFCTMPILSKFAIKKSALAIITF
jgi:hypothetical protein